MIWHSYAKINLFLDVMRPYKSGFHPIRSIFSTISLADTITFKPNDENKLLFKDNSGSLPEINTLTEAARVMTSSSEISTAGYTFTIDKKIPMGGGLGGGSSNGAAVLRILNQIYCLRYGKKKLVQMASMVGSDVPFFIFGGMACIFGRGEIVKPFKSNSGKLNLLLIFPGIHISTKDAYSKMDELNLCSASSGRKKQMRCLVDALKAGDYDNIVDNIFNLFEKVVWPGYPQLQKIHDVLLSAGADRAFMSGSGSTMVGLFHSAKIRDRALITMTGNNYQAIAATTI